MLVLVEKFGSNHPVGFDPDFFAHQLERLAPPARRTCAVQLRIIKNVNYLHYITFSSLWLVVGGSGWRGIVTLTAKKYGDESTALVVS